VNIIAAVIIAVTHAVIVKPINYFYAKKLKVIKYICSFILIAAVLVNIYMILAIAAIDMRDNGKSN
jgi:Na+-driven multidrug efflux pump